MPPGSENATLGQQFSEGRGDKSVGAINYGNKQECDTLLAMIERYHE